MTLLHFGMTFLVCFDAIELAEVQEGLMEDVGCRSVKETRPLLITVDALQQLIGCGKTTAFSLFKRGEIETVMMGRKRLAVYESAERYVARLREKAGSSAFQRAA